MTGPHSGFVGWVTAIKPGTEGNPNIFVVNASQEKEVMNTG